MINIIKLDFSGQHIYIGIDVHKKSWSVCITCLDFDLSMASVKDIFDNFTQARVNSICVRNDSIRKMVDGLGEVVFASSTVKIRFKTLICITFLMCTLLISERCNCCLTLNKACFDRLPKSFVLIIKILNRFHS
jgi:hypothetical protein